MCNHDSHLKCYKCAPDVFRPSIEQARAYTIAYLAERILEAKAAYYAGKPILRDEQYDALEVSLRAYAPDHEVLQKVGSDSVSE